MKFLASVALLVFLFYQVNARGPHRATGKCENSFLSKIYLLLTYFLLLHRKLIGS